MLKFAFIGSTNSWYLEDLRRAAEPSVAITSIDYNELWDGGGVSPGVEFDAAILRSMPAGSLEQVVFRMDALAQLELSGVYMLNGPRSMEVAIDKFLATARLIRAGIESPATHVSQTWKTALEGFNSLGGDVVIKPLFGGEGRGVTRVSDIDLAERAFKMLQQMGAVIYQQQFIEHDGSDMRVLLLGDKVWGMRRRSDDWRTNVSRGARAEPLAVTSDLEELARRAADAVGAEFAGVDILVDRAGKRYVLEVNAVPGWKALSKVLNVDIAREVISHVVRRVAEFR